MKIERKTLTPELLRRMHAYWRAANYLSDSGQTGCGPRHAHGRRTRDSQDGVPRCCPPGGKEMYHEDEED
jgi:hypothetical protein